MRLRRRSGQGLSASSGEAAETDFRYTSEGAPDGCEMDSTAE
jgi:hypothetical protein